MGRQRLPGALHSWLFYHKYPPASINFANFLVKNQKSSCKAKTSVLQYILDIFAKGEQDMAHFKIKVADLLVDVVAKGELTARICGLVSL